MDLGIYLYVEKYKIIDQKNTYQAQDSVYLLRRKEIGHEGNMGLDDLSHSVILCLHSIQDRAGLCGEHRLWD